MLSPLCSSLRVVLEARVTAGPSSLISLENSADSLSGLILNEGVLLRSEPLLLSLSAESLSGKSHTLVWMVSVVVMKLCTITVEWDLLLCSILFCSDCSHSSSSVGEGAAKKYSAPSLSRSMKVFSFLV